MKIAVLGGGNGSYAAAADLAEQGHDVQQGHDVHMWHRDARAVLIPEDLKARLPAAAFDRQA